MNANYYFKHKKKLIKDFKGLIKKNKIVLERFYNDKTVEDIINKTVKNYSGLIPEIPYVGGKENHLTEMLISSVQALSMIITLKDLGESKGKIGEIIYRIAENRIRSVNPVLLFFIRIMFFSKTRLKKMKNASLKSQDKKYSENWVYKTTIGKDTDFTFTNTYSECGIYKFYKKMGYEEYVPYLCLTDYALFKGLKVRLERSKTIGNGDEICNFKFIRNGKPVEGWPPEKLKEFKA